MKRTKLIIIGLMVMLFAASAAYTQPESKYQQHRDKQREHIFKELNLTPQQQKKLEDNRMMQRQETDKIFTALRDKQAKLHEMLKSPTVSKIAVKPLANEIKSLQAQLFDQRINGIFAVKEILTPEQFAKFQQMTRNRREGKKERFEQWREKRKCRDLGQKETEK